VKTSRSRAYIRVVVNEKGAEIWHTYIDWMNI